MISSRVQNFNDLTSLLDECKYNKKMVNHLYGKREFHGCVIVKISPDKDPEISRVSDSLLILTN